MTHRVVTCYAIFMRYILTVALATLVGCQQNPNEHAPGDRYVLRNGPPACRPYAPGNRLRFATYETRVRAIGNHYEPTFSFEAYEAFNRALDLEMTEALYEVFSHAADPQTQILYGSFSERPHFKDGAIGFRAIWTRTVRDPQGNRRFISVITFWTFRNGRLALVGGPDGLRIRTQLEADSATYTRGRFGGISYELQLGADGRITGLEPGLYTSRTGTMKEGVPPQAMPTACIGCHSAGSQTGQLHHAPNNPGRNGTSMWGDLRDFLTDERALTPANVSSIEAFLQTIPEARRTRQLIDSFQRPRQTFFPVGILEALRERCRTLSRR